MYRSALVGVFLVACSSPSNSVDAPPVDAAPLACAPFDITVQPVKWLDKPIWTGSEYLVLTQRSPGVMQRIGADGTIGPTFSIGTDVPDIAWPIAWTGSELGVVYSEASSNGYALKLAHYSHDGTQLGTSTIADGFSSTVVNSNLRWAGDRYVVAWMSAGMLNIEDVFPNGVLATHAMGVVTEDRVYALASSPTTDMAVVTNQLGGVRGSYVTVDRATGAMSQHDVATGVSLTTLLVRDDNFIAYSSSGTSAVLQTIDAAGMETTSLPVPIPLASDMALLPDRFHLVEESNDASGRSIKDVDVGLDGTQLGPVNVRATITTTGSYTSAYVASRGNGVITGWADGPHDAMTARLIQDCDP